MPTLLATLRTSFFKVRFQDAALSHHLFPNSLRNPSGISRGTRCAMQLRFLLAFLDYGQEHRHNLVLEIHRGLQEIREGKKIETPFHLVWRPGLGIELRRGDEADAGCVSSPCPAPPWTLNGSISLFSTGISPMPVSLVKKVDLVPESRISPVPPNSFNSMSGASISI